MRKWLPSFSDCLKTLAHQIEKWVTFCRWHVKKLLRLNSPPRIQPYRGFGDGTNWYLMGRVLENRPLTKAKETDPRWRNMMATLRRFMTDEVPDATVLAMLGDQQHEAISDEEGFFSFHSTHDFAEALVTPSDWQEVELQLKNEADETSDTRATAFLRIPGEQVEFGVISDVDDTIIQSHATNFVFMAKLTLMNNAYTRTPLPGVERFYRALERGLGGTANNPFFYVSSSAWNMYDLIEEFLHVHDIPVGPILLRDLGIDDQKFIKSGHEHKYEKIDRIMSFYSDRAFVLVGDAGQDDPVIYAEVVKRTENRIKAIYIRSVKNEPRNDRARRIAEEMSALGIPMILVEDSDQAIAHAIEIGLIAKA
jgi:phosphatidate phosphatase APP1